MARAGTPSNTSPLGQRYRRLLALGLVTTGTLVGCTGRIEVDLGAAPATPVMTVTPPGSQAPINPGRVVAHRLNNVEYDNTMRDLVGVDLSPSNTYGFPDDAYIDGFDNNADALTVPPLLLEKLETATEAIV